MAGPTAHISTPALRATALASPAPVVATPTRRSTPLARSPMLQTGPPAVRLSPGTPILAPRNMSGISGGQPLPSPVQRAIEGSLQVDMQAVRVHSDPQAQSQARNLSARAFAYGNHIFLGPGERATDLGLMAHESAHVVQQQAMPMIQRSAPGQSDSYEREAQQASAAVLHREPFTVHERTSNPRVQRKSIFDKVSGAISGAVDFVAEAAKKLGLDKALNYVADKANLIPGFRMFTVILGVNPINMSKVDRSASNILRALIEVIPGGALITEALQNHGIFDKVGKWVEQQIQTLGMVGSSIKKAITDFLTSLELKDLADLGGVWERAKRIFTEPIDRIISFAKGLITDIIKFIKDAILMPLAKLAEGTEGYNLLKAVLGKDPITGDKVPRTAENLIGPFMKLIGEGEVWETMKKANSIPRAWAWFQDALKAAMEFVSQIPTLAMNAFKSLELVDIVLVPRALMKVAAVFGGFVGNFIRWAGKAVWNLLEIIFDVVKPGALEYIKKTGAALKSILKNPLPFVGNLVKAAKLGFQNFADNIGTHLKAGLIDWLTGSLSGVYIPKALTLPEVGKFALSILGVTWAQIRGKIVKALGPNGETIMQGLETTFDVVKALVTGGPAAAWEVIKEKLTDLKDMAIDAIKGFVVDTIVKKAIPKLIGMFIPGAGFIPAIISIYDTVMVFVDKIAKIIQVVTAFIDSIVAIAAGNIGAAAKRVEGILAGLLSLAISFLAGFLSLGKVTDKITEVIGKVRDKVDKALDAAVAWIVDKAKKLFGAAKAGVAKVTAWWKAKIPFTTKGGESHEISYSGDEKNAIPMVASSEKKPVQIKLDEFYKKANGAEASVEEKSSKALIEKTRNDAKKNPNDPNLKDNLAKLFDIYYEAGPGKLTKTTRKTKSLGGDTVGVEMTIDWLGSEHEAGTEPESGAQDNLMGLLVTEPVPGRSTPEKYIRGHLLNHNLGGKGNAENMFPITGYANSQHLRSTESKIKKWVEVKSNWVFYEVKVQGISSKLDAGPKSPFNYVNSTFVCHAILKDKTGKTKEEFSTSISSIFLVKMKAEEVNKIE